MAATGRNTAFKTLQLLASLTSIATCLLVVARSSPQTGGRWPILGLKQLVTSGWSSPGAAHGAAREVAPAPVAGMQPNPVDVAAAAVAAAAGYSLLDCLEAAREGHWRRVLDTSNRTTLPADVATWSASDTFEYNGEMFSYEWAWDPQALACGVRRRTKAEVASLLSNARLRFVGDSHVRYFHNWLAVTLGGKEMPRWTGPASPLQINQTFDAVNVSLAFRTRIYAHELKEALQSWNEPWPHVLVVDGSEWHLLREKNMTAYTQTMRELLQVLREVVPPSTFTLWVSPPPRDEKKWYKPDLPPEWIRLYDLVAKELGFYMPTGPAYHLDLYQLALDCLPWCTLKDGVHANPTVNDVLLQQMINMFALRQAWHAATQLIEPAAI